MPSVQINGKRQELTGSLSLDALLEHLRIALDATAIAVNDEVIPRSQLSDTIINDGDRIEVIRAVGGG